MLPNNECTGFDHLNVDAFAQSLGLGFTPALPVSNKAAAGAGGVGDGEEKKKNVNRALDKLKKQIKEAKAAKRLEREKGADIKTSTTKVKASPDYELEDEEDDLLVAKKDSVDQSVRPQTDHSSDTEQQTTIMQSSSTSNKSKKRNNAGQVKISFDGIDSIRGGLGAKRKKLVYDEDGNSRDHLHDFKPVSKRLGDGEEEVDESKMLSDMMSHRTAVRQRIDAHRTEDNVREKLRIKEKHLSEKIKTRESRTANENPELQQRDVKLNSDSKLNDSDTLRMQEQKALAMLI